MKRLYLLLPLSVVLFLSALFLSFVNVEVAFTVQGIVMDDNNEPVFNARVALEKEEGEEIEYFEPTDPNGRFELKFNAVEGKPLSIHIEKDHFHGKELEIIPSTTKKEYPKLIIKLERNYQYTLKTSSTLPY